MNILKKWWFWVLIVLFFAINLFINSGQKPDSNRLPPPQDRVGTH